jgi:riboflavin synthase
LFTGIIEEIGTISHIAGVGQALRLTISCKRVLEDVHVGDSIAVNGICLTVTQFDPRSFQSDVMPETFRSTSLGELKAASRVNLERALPLGGRLGGHLVSGHIDGTGRIIRRKKENNALWLEIEASAAIMKYVVMKGSVTRGRDQPDGISLAGQPFCRIPDPAHRRNDNAGRKKHGQSCEYRMRHPGKVCGKIDAS